MYPTKYHTPKTLSEAQKIFAAAASPAYLSGGHTLLPAMKLRLAAHSDLIDLSAIPEMHGFTQKADRLSIGAMTRHHDVANSALVAKLIPALAGCAGSIGDRHVRHRGTIGGSVANNDPAADYPAALLGLGAIIVTDKRQLVADEFFTGLYQTALQPGEILLQVEFPIPQIAAYAKFRSLASRYSVVGVFISQNNKKVRVAVTGAGAGGVFRVQSFEAALEKDFSPSALVTCSVDPAYLMADASGSSEYRANLINVMARRAVENPGKTSCYN
ncbi:MAG: carbon monoxide dehydrogenase [Acidocella sp. 20-57-95]|nr:MAG: carbon monoxide dehydrogenase [Acidocella sp. 20-57-95]OYV60377.1 MAG: carbon monoxide dehydrogenase [Acidocella sp. 21-58-7]HQT64816.1 xanthine dehydrogenase family protein subunit M [Acidocella sp.]